MSAATTGGLGRRGLRAVVAIFAVALAAFAAGVAPSAALPPPNTTATIQSVQPQPDGTYAVTVVVHATAASGLADPTAGSVALTDNGAPMNVSAPLAGSNTVSIPVTLGVGPHSLQAQYASTGPPYQSSALSTAFPYTVSTGQSYSTALSISPATATITAGDHVTLTVTVVVTGDYTAIPAGAMVNLSYSPNSTPIQDATTGETDKPVTLTPTAGGATGTVTWDTLWPTAGTYTITPAYAGATSVQTSQVVVQSGPVDQWTTTGSVSASPSLVQAGRQVTLTAHVTRTGTGSVPPLGGQVQFLDVTSYPTTYPLGTAALAVDPGGGTGTATLTLAWPAFLTGNRRIDVVYDTGSVFTPATLTVVPSAQWTSLALGGPATILRGGTATYTATLTDGDGNGIAGEPISFGGLANASSCTATTGAGGVATCSFPVADAAGAHTLTATYAGSFDGTSGYSPSQDGKQVEVQEQPALAFTADSAATGFRGQPVTLKAKLVDGGGSPMSGQTVAFALGTAGCPSAQTDANGVATCRLTIPAGQPLGDAAPTATFAGAGDYLPVIATGTLVVTSQAPTAISVENATAVYHRPAVLKAHLVSGSTPVSGASVSLTATGTGGTFTCTATTNTAGTAACQIADVTLKPGHYAVTASFAGNDRYQASDNTATPGSFDVAKAPTALTITVARTAVSGSTLTITATLKTSDGVAASGEAVALSLDGVACSSPVTDANGGTSCTVTLPRTTGYRTVRARFGGDDFYLAAPDATASVLVYAVVSAHGSFVIGDRNAAVGSSVTFWGSQWAKRNSLSHGPAPSAFKGYAALVHGDDWIAGTGDAHAPDDPLPGYIAVVVASSVHKLGPAILGDVVGMVVVRTDPGYRDDPGHPGTGTVVASL